MPIPKFQVLMKPLLEVLKDGKPRPMGEVIETLAKRFHLTPEELSMMVPSGRRPLFHDRVGWARTYLGKAGLLESPQRGYIRITERGKRVLEEGVEEINTDFLMRFEEFREFIEASQTPKGSRKEGARMAQAPEEEKTPYERLEGAYLQLRSALISEIEGRIQGLSPKGFERLVVDLLVRMGYRGPGGQAQVVGGPGDGGIDGIIEQDPLGVDVLYVQAKRRKDPVGRPELERFKGILETKRAKRGVFITSSQFTQEAKDFAERAGLILMDGRRLAELMFEHGLGVSPVKVYEVKRIDSDYFEELKEGL